MLMNTGEVMVWWPSMGRLAEVIEEKAQGLNSEGIGFAEATEDGTIPCYTWQAAVNPVLLPSLPPLPDIRDIGDEYKKNLPRLVQLGGMDSHLVGLTNYAHVVIFRGLDHGQAIGTRGWEYVWLAICMCLNIADNCHPSSQNSAKCPGFKSYRSSRRAKPHPLNQCR